MKSTLKVALVALTLVGFQQDAVFAQDTEVKEEKAKGKKEKEKKNSGKIDIADKKAEEWIRKNIFGEEVVS